MDTPIDRSPSPMIGVGLWGMRSTGRKPTQAPRLFADAVADARYAEELGFDSLWLSEHRFWYDGWCPQPLLVAAAMTAATESLRVGTAMMLLPQHDPHQAAAKVAALEELSNGRLELGVSIGYRPEEYSGMGLAMSQRGRLMDASLDIVQAKAPSSSIWVGGMSPPAVKRAARRGLSLLLPPTLTVEQVTSIREMACAEADRSGAARPRIGILKDTWISTRDEEAENYYIPRLRAHYTEYVTAWWARMSSDQSLAQAATRKQVDRNVSTAAVGTPDTVIDHLSRYLDAGVDLIVLQPYSEQTSDRHRTQMELLATHVVGALAGPTQ